MAIESKNLLVWVKAMSRGQALPLDASEIHESLAAAQTYAASAIAYPGQTIKAKLEDGKYHEYILQPTESGYVLEEAGSDIVASLKQYVMVVESLPESGQEEGILYINTAEPAGYVYNNGWKKVFWDITSDVDALSDRIDDVEEALDAKAPIENPVFSGVVKVGEDEVALKSYVEGLFANLVSAEPGIVDAAHPLPTNYKAGQHFRVAEDGTYAGVDCEVGDLILVVKNYNAETASNADFMVLQANIDGAVTSASEISTVGEIVVFDSVTGKVIKGSGVQIASLNDTIAKAHEHANKNILDTYDKTQSDLLAAAESAAQSIVDALEGTVNEALAGKANKGTTLAEYGITDAYNKTEIDASLKTITDNLNTKASSVDVASDIATAKAEALEEAATSASEALEIRVGAIPADTTIKSYIDTAVGSGGTASAEAIAAAKQEAISTSKTYTDEKIVGALAIVEF